jgi:hypothetical protein
MTTNPRHVIFGTGAIGLAVDPVRHEDFLGHVASP